MPPKDTSRIVQKVVEDGRVTSGSQDELEAEFKFEASEQGWTDEEIEQVTRSPWFPS